MSLASDTYFFTFFLNVLSAAVTKSGYIFLQTQHRIIPRRYKIYIVWDNTMSEISEPISPKVMTTKQKIELDDLPRHRETEIIQHFIPIPFEEDQQNLDERDLLSEIKIEPTKLQLGREEVDRSESMGRNEETIESPNKTDFSMADSRPKTKKTLERLYCCADCGKRYARKAFLRKHNQECAYSTNPTGGALNRCPQCPAVFKILKQLRYHMNKHNGEKCYKCKVDGCSKAFFSPHTLASHMMKHREPKHECTICFRRFFKREEMRKHWERHFAAINVMKDLVLGDSTLIEKKLENDEQQSQESAQHDAAEFPEDADWDRMIDLPAAYTCNLCAVGFPNERILNMHIIYCNNPNPPIAVRKDCIQCPFCPKLFKTKTNLQQHINRHNGQKSVPCRKEGCTKLFAETTARWKHEVFCGKDVKLICIICDAILKTPDSLRAHMKIHEGSGFACEICGKSFSQRANLVRHSALHSNGLGTKCRKTKGRKDKRSKDKRSKDKMSKRQKVEKDKR